MEAEDGRLLHLEPLEDPFAVEFAVPPLATLTLGLTRDPLIPLGAGNGLVVGWEGRTLELEAADSPWPGAGAGPLAQTQPTRTWC